MTKLKVYNVLIIAVCVASFAFAFLEVNRLRTQVADLTNEIEVSRSVCDVKVLAAYDETWKEVCLYTEGIDNCLLPPSAAAPLEVFTSKLLEECKY